MKKIITKIFIVICMMNMIVFNINTVQASALGNVFSGGDAFILAGKKGEATLDTDKLQSASSDIYNILLVIGICVAIITISILGIKFMIGSIEEKAQVKEALVPFIIGCIVVFGAFGIWKIVTQIGSMIPTIF
ncbi:MAG: hypothetical protein BHW00_04410 [Clostridium sp. 26_22]|nr:MAG: hypothetical protein BHW00_04410 [Clostridium sp. 26_22]